jgi:hypothetical protein
MTPRNPNNRNRFRALRVASCVVALLMPLGTAELITRFALSVDSAPTLAQAAALMLA